MQLACFLFQTAVRNLANCLLKRNVNSIRNLELDYIIAFLGRLQVRIYCFSRPSTAHLQGFWTVGEE